MKRKASSNLDASQQADTYSLITDTKNIPALQQQVLQRPNDYNAHLVLIQALRDNPKRQGDLAQARHAFSQLFPLSTNLWQEWIHDEERMVSSDADRLKIVELYRRALADYYSIEMWKNLVEYAIDLHLDSPEDLNIADLRNILQAAQSATMYDMSDSQVWNMIKDFEVRLMESDAGQLAKIRNMYRQRLQTPHRNIDDTWSDYSTFESQHDASNYEANMIAMKNVYNAGKASTDEREEFERQVSQGLWALEAFVDWESKKTKEFQRIQVLYERAITMNPLDVSIWNSYLEYLVSHVKVHTILESVSERSIRNCPWSADLWLHRVTILEHQGPEQVVQIFNKALENQALQANYEELYKLLKGNVEWCLRNKQNASSTLGQALTMLQQFHADKDPYERFERFAARVYSHDLHEMVPARQVYSALIKKYASESSLWIEYAMAEVDNNAVDKARSLMKQSIQRYTDGPEVLFETWLMIERQYGTTESLYDALYRIRNRRREIVARTAQAVEEVVVEPPNKRVKDNHVENVQAHLQQAAQPAAQPAQTMEVDVYDVPRDVTEVEMRESSPPKLHPQGEDPRTVYVSRLTLKATKPILTDLFAKYGDIKDVRLVKRSTGAFAYIEFSDSSSAQASLEMDNHVLDGKPMGVAISNPQLKKAPEPVHADPKEIFVKNLPRSFGEDELRNLFSQHGTVLGVRILKFPDGLSRGLGFVDFATAEEANSALNLNGTTVEGRVITVEHSDPNAKKRDDKKPAKPQEKPQEKPKETMFLPRSAALGAGGRKKRLAM